ncbi:MAG TPA: MoaD/ThiS family protein [Ktedonobacterales bacterium]|jgi:sulfur carrier protein ThiS|nr:MoaD/ThiS family protein [Ktedonobacterales bacterium]
MRVIVSAYGDLRRHLLAGEPERAVELRMGATLAELTEELGAGPDDAILARRGSTVLREASVLADGDYVELFAPVGGG